MPAEIFMQELQEILKKKKLSKQELVKEKIRLCKKYKIKEVPTDIEILLNAKEKDMIQSKTVRTASGVSVIAIMSAPYACPHGKCTFCPGGPGSVFGDVPQSYTGREPATMRGIRNKYSAYLQVMNRLEHYCCLGQSQDKIELIIMGGTFPAMPKDYQETFVIDALQAMNDFSTLFFEGTTFNFDKFKEFFELPGKVEDPARTERIQKRCMDFKKQKTLEQVQQENETSNVRCIGMTIETKPDWGFAVHGRELLKLGCTRIELGIQTVYDKVLKAVNRGHTNADTIKSVRELKDLGFKINAHYMPGLPLTTKEEDIAGMKELFNNPDYRPDMLKIYPCMVAPGTPMYQQYKAGLFKPLSTEEAAERIIELKKIIPEYCRIQRIQRDVPTKQWVDGVGITNLRQFIHETYKPKCRCVRCREPMGRSVDMQNIQIKITEYTASQGTEYFIAAEDPTQDMIVGFCRLRFPSESLIPEITNTSAIVRELHVFGNAVKIGDKGDMQHKGIGKQLMQKAEEIALQHNKDKIVVISGIGVREYYRAKLGYKREGPYMIKLLSNN